MLYVVYAVNELRKERKVLSSGYVKKGNKPQVYFSSGLRGCLCMKESMPQRVLL